jgi:hypothetical protein
MLYSDSFTGIKTKILPGLSAFLRSPWLLLALAAELWAFSLQSFNLDAMQDWGLVSVFPVTIILAYLLLLISFASLFSRKNVTNLVFFAHVFLYVVMMHGTPQFLYGTLRYSWAWKHVGIIDYIIRHQAINPNIEVLPVYHNWPGFFALNAMFTELAGFSSAHIYAGWGPVFFETLFALSLFALFRLFTTDRRIQWLGVWLFLLTNWVGQDYFAPQAFTYFLLIVVFILALTGFGVEPQIFHEKFITRFARAAKFLRLPMRFQRWVLGLKPPPMHISEGKSASHWILKLMILLIFGVIVSTHQLTPPIGLFSALFLVLFGLVRWRVLPIWMLLLVVFWLVFPARAYNNTVIGSTLESFGKINQTVDSGFVDVAQISAGQAVVSWMGRGLSAAIILLGGLGAFWRLRKGYLDLPALLLAVAPFLVLFLNSYGGEALFRVFFFMLPYLAFLAAAALAPSRQTTRNWLHSVMIGGLSLVFLVAFLFAYYGKERQYSFTKLEVEAAEYLYSNASPNSLLVEGSRNYPTLFLNYENFTYVAIDREPKESVDNLIADPETVLYRWLSDSRRYSSSYLIITRSQKLYTDEIRGIPSGSLEKVETILRNSNMFEVVYSNKDAVIFRVNRKYTNE